MIPQCNSCSTAIPTLRSATPLLSPMTLFQQERSSLFVCTQKKLTSARSREEWKMTNLRQACKRKGERNQKRSPTCV